MTQPTLSIRTVLVTLGALSILVATGLAAFGLAEINQQLETRKQVAALEQALTNHDTADSFMDNVRSDVLRAMLSTSGANKEGEDAIRAEVDHHTNVIEARIADNLALPLTPTLHEQYIRLAALARSFTPAGQKAIELALVDPPAASANFEHFRQDFTGLETLMDEVRDALTAAVEQVRKAAARTASRSKATLMVSSGVGMLVMGFMTLIALRIATRITTALAHSREQAQRLALHDALTGLPNRAFLTRRLTEALSRADQRTTTLAVLCIDLDRFKQVNDTLGHSMGDALLREVAHRLQGCLRRTDTVARLGGDEFAIIQAPLGNAEGEASALAHRIVQALSQTFELHGHRVVAGASVGIALAPTHASDTATLLRMADTALYRAKSDGRGVHRVFEPAMDEKLQARQSLETDLREAVERQEFVLHYQPLVELASGRVDAVETLIRWRHPERGLVWPNEFIPVAEETGLIEAIGTCVLRQACADAARWPDHVRIAVNVSALQLARPGLVDAVRGALEASQLLPNRLELEITETALLSDATVALAMLRELRSVGVRIVIDNFGTGYSALATLRSFPFDKIKIDRRLTSELETQAGSKAIVRAIIGLGSDLGMTTTAEGVETTEQLRLVKAAACGQAQGYLFSQPVPCAEIGALLERSMAADDTGALIPSENKRRLALA